MFIPFSQNQPWSGAGAGPLIVSPWGAAAASSAAQAVAAAQQASNSKYVNHVGSCLTSFDTTVRHLTRFDYV